jgi:hypothetical protein
MNHPVLMVPYITRSTRLRKQQKNFGVRPSWLYERTRRNAVPCRRLGKYVRFSTPIFGLSWKARKLKVGAFSEAARFNP